MAIKVFLQNFGMDLGPQYLLVLLTLLTNFRAYSFHNDSVPEPKIVGGWLATFERTRHQVSVQVGKVHICGGAIISLTKVLTAAHCLFNIYAKPIYVRPPEEFRLVMGTLHLDRWDSNALVYKVQRYVHHKSFSLNTLRNDIAIMFLNGIIPEFHLTAQVIPLPTMPEVAGTVCNVNGWGATEMDGSSQPDLRTTNVTIIRQALCRTTYKNLNKGMICAGDWEGGIDSCQGDSGGPLSCNGVLVGVVSWGDKCGLPERPGVYTDVLYYRDWIVANGGNSKYIFKFLIILILFNSYSNR